MIRTIVYWNISPYNVKKLSIDVKTSPINQPGTKMITQFGLENFKAFSHKQSMKLAPITLIYGPNSSGKSSIIQALMMLQQSLTAQEQDGKLITSGPSINLGTFESLIHKQDNNLSMRFSIEYNSNHVAQEYKQKHSYDMLFANSDLREVELTYEYTESQPFLNNLSFTCSNKLREKVSFKVARSRHTSDGTNYTLVSRDSLEKAIVDREKIGKSDGKSWINLTDYLTQPFRISKHLNIPSIPSSGSEGINSYTDRVIDDLSYAINDFKYLGPLRSSPKKIYSEYTEKNNRGQGKNNLGLEMYNSSSDTIDKINDFLIDFNIPYKLSVKDLGDINTGPLISIQLEDLRNGTIVTPKDVGFGIGQVLPIILEAIVSNNKLICVEQPEIHLHPRLQAHLADLFIESTKSGKNNQWIIETHSEALMLRIQRRIREGIISKDLISVIYIDVGESGAQVTHLRLDDEGDFLTHWPNGFFEERLNEVFGG